MSTTQTNAICVWYDSYSSPDDRGWVVSLDELSGDDLGTAETTHTLRMLFAEDEDAAIAWAAIEGERRGLPVYENGEHGGSRLLFAAPATVEE